MTQQNTPGTTTQGHDPDPTTLEDAVRTNAAYQNGQTDLDDRLRRRNATLLIAWDDGWPITAIARAFDLTHGRISQLIANIKTQIAKDHHERGMTAQTIAADRELPVALVERILAEQRERRNPGKTSK